MDKIFLLNDTAHLLPTRLLPVYRFFRGLGTSAIFLSTNQIAVLYFSQSIRLFNSFFLKQKKKQKSIKHTVKNINLFTKKYENKLFTFYKFYDNFIVIFAF